MVGESTRCEKACTHECLIADVDVGHVVDQCGDDVDVAKAGSNVEGRVARLVLFAAVSTTATRSDAIA